MCSSHNRACPSLSRPDSVAHLVNHPGLFSLFRLLWLSTLGLSLVRVFSHRDGQPSDRIGAILWILIFRSPLWFLRFPLWTCFHTGAHPLSSGHIWSFTSSFSLGTPLLDCRCLHVNSHVRVLLLHALFCVFEFGTLVACLTLRVRALEKTPSHYGRCY